jgi:hypothetical protein
VSAVPVMVTDDVPVMTAPAPVAAAPAGAVAP